jgi:hypothetical protein
MWRWRTLAAFPAIIAVFAASVAAVAVAGCVSGDYRRVCSQRRGGGGRWLRFR